MKKLPIFVFLLFVTYCFSQSINDYEAVIIPLKFDFQKVENQYRLQTISKMNLQKVGFQAFYATEPIPAKFTERCSLLYMDVKKENTFLVTKLYVMLKDCYGTIIYQSEIGKSREKEFEVSYVEALNNAFVSVALQYNYNGNTNFIAKAGVPAQSLPDLAAPSVVAPTPALAVIPEVSVSVVADSTLKNEPKTTEIPNPNMLYAQSTSYGYQLIDSEPKVVMKVYKTSNPLSFMATKGSVQGILVAKDNQWFFEYYQNDQLISEMINIKF